MSAANHATDANSEALRLTLALQDLCDNALHGAMPTVEQLTALHRASVRVQYYTARAMHDVAKMPAPDRREVCHA